MAVSRKRPSWSARIWSRRCHQTVNRPGVGRRTNSLSATRRCHPYSGNGAAASNLLVLSADAAAMLGRPDLVSRIDLSSAGADREQSRQRVEAELAGQAQLRRPSGRVAGSRKWWPDCGQAYASVALALLVGLFSSPTSWRQCGRAPPRHRHPQVAGPCLWQIGAVRGRSRGVGLAGSVLGCRSAGPCASGL